MNHSFIHSFIHVYEFNLPKMVIFVTLIYSWRNIYLLFSSNSEALASELLGNIEYMFSLYYMNSDIVNNFKSLTYSSKLSRSRALTCVADVDRDILNYGISLQLSISYHSWNTIYGIPFMEYHSCRIIELNYIRHKWYFIAGMIWTAGTSRVPTPSHASLWEDLGKYTGLRQDFPVEIQRISLLEMCMSRKEVILCSY